MSQPVRLPLELVCKIKERINPLRKGKVLLIGDSMLGRFQPYGTGAGLLDPEVFDNIAIGGTTTNHWIHLLESDYFKLSSTGGYDHVVLMIGTNNLSQTGFKADDMVEGIEKIRILLSQTFPRASLHFVLIQPRFDLTISFQSDMDKINAAVQNMNILSPKFDYPSMYSEDKLHLNHVGYAFFAKYLSDYFAK